MNIDREIFTNPVQLQNNRGSCAPLAEKLTHKEWIMLSDPVCNLWLGLIAGTNS